MREIATVTAGARNHVSRRQHWRLNQLACRWGWGVGKRVEGGERREDEKRLALLATDRRQRPGAFW